MASTRGDIGFEGFDGTTLLYTPASGTIFSYGRGIFPVGAIGEIEVIDRSASDMT